MKATLEFNIDEPDDSMAFDRAVKGTDLCLALWEIKSELRSKLKYSSDEMSEETYNAIESIQEFIVNTLVEKGINLDKLIA